MGFAAKTWKSGYGNHLAAVQGLLADAVAAKKAAVAAEALGPGELVVSSALSSTSASSCWMRPSAAAAAVEQAVVLQLAERCDFA